MWARRASRPTAVKQTQYDYLYLFGAVCPASGDSMALIAPRADTSIMNLFLERFAAALPTDVQAIMILDNAGWHHSKELLVPPNVTLIYLPPRAPELNPIERLWLWLKSHYWSNRAYVDYLSMLAAAEHAWQQTIREPGRVASVCRASYLDQERAN